MRVTLADFIPKPFTITHCGEAGPHRLMRIENSYNEGDERLYCYYYDIVKATPTGVWIDRWGDKKFINMAARKKWAHASLSEALHAFIMRRSMQVRILSTQHDKAKWFLHVAREIERKMIDGRTDV